MPSFNGGVCINKTHKGGRCKSDGKYLRIRAGVLRGVYVHTLVAEAKLGRKLLPSETAEHKNGDGLDCSPDNIIVVERPENTRLMHKRRNGKAKEHAAAEA